MSRRKSSSWPKLLRGFYLVALVATVVPLGAVHGPVIAVSCLLFSGVAVASLFRTLRPELQPAMLWATGLVGVLVAWILVQGLAVLGVNPVWLDAAKVLDDVGTALSAAPGAGFAGLPTLLIPAIAFVSGIVLFQEDADAQLLFRALGFLALAGALLGLYEYAATPGQLMFQTRTHTMDAVTAYFVNRNTAATFLGIGAVIWCAQFADKLRVLGLGGVRRIFLQSDPDSRSEALRLIALTLCLLAVVVALFLTKSRAGIAATLVGVVVVLVGTLGAHSRDGGGVSRLAVVALSVGFVAAATIAYGDQFLARTFGADASQDPRWCFASDMVTAILERPLTGFGFGSLEYVYPAFRNPSCMSLALVLDRGHNGYLEWAMGLGLPSLVLLLAGILYLAVTLARGVATRRSFRLIPAASLGALAVVTIHTAFDFSMQIPGVATYAATVLAAGVVVSLPDARTRRHRSRQPSSLMHSALAAT